MTRKKNTTRNSVFVKFSKWLDEILDNNLPIGGNALVFNLYEESEMNWSIQIASVRYFDEKNSDWGCDEIFSSGEKLFTWQQELEWKEILDISHEMICKYLDEGKYSVELKKYKAIGMGFVDGDLHIIYRCKQYEGNEFVI